MVETVQAGGKFALSLAFSPDTELLAVGGMDGIIKIFSTNNYDLQNTIEGHAMPIRSIAFSADSQFMMSASDDGHIKGKTFINRVYLGRFYSRTYSGSSLINRNTTNIFCEIKGGNKI